MVEELKGDCQLLFALAKRARASIAAILTQRAFRNQVALGLLDNLLKSSECGLMKQGQLRSWSIETYDLVQSLSKPKPDSERRSTALKCLVHIWLHVRVTNQYWSTVDRSVPSVQAPETPEKQNVCLVLVLICFIYQMQSKCLGMVDCLHEV